MKKPRVNPFIPALGVSRDARKIPNIGPVVYDIIPKARTTTFTFPRSESIRRRKAESKDSPNQNQKSGKKQSLFSEVGFCEVSEERKGCLRKCSKNRIKTGYGGSKYSSKD